LSDSKTPLFREHTLMQLLTAVVGTRQASSAMQQVASVVDGAADQKTMFDGRSPLVRD
jgi:hypothetical protein